MERRAQVDAGTLLAHAEWMGELATRLLGDPGAADDVVQATWLAALRRPPRADLPLEPWLARVLRNFAWKRRRGEARRAEHEARAAAPAPEPTPAETLERLELQRALVELVASIDEPLRTTLVLRFFEGRTSVEIARLQRVPEGTVRWRVKRGVEELRERMDRRFGARDAWCALLAPLVRRGGELAAGTTAAAGAAATAGGVLAMGAAMKIGAAAACAAALAGAAWWTLGVSGGPVEPRAPEPAVALADPTLRAPADSAAPQAVEPGEERLAARSPGAAEAEAAPAEPADSEPALLPPARVQVRFVDRHGTPWSGVRVEVPGDPPVEPATSTGDGRVELALVVPGAAGRRFALVARRTGCATALLEPTLRPGQVAHLGDVVLGPGGRIAGRVVDSEGRPVAGARVGAAEAELPRGRLPEVVRRLGCDAFVGETSTRSGADGSFSLEGVEPGARRVWGHVEGHAYAWTEPLQVEPGGSAAGVELVLPRLTDEDFIAGRVVDARGARVAQAGLEVVGTGAGGSRVHFVSACDAEGRFRFLVWMDGEYHLFASGSSLQEGSGGAFGVRPGARDLEIILAAPRWIEVRARDRDGERVADPDVVVAHPEGWNVSHRSDAGYPEPTYPYTVAVSARGFRGARIGPLQPGAQGDVLDVVLEEVTRVRGRVVAGGAPLPGARVEVVRGLAEGAVLKDDFEMRMSTHASAEDRTGADGAFELGVDLAPDVEVYVRARAEGWATAEVGPLRLAALTGLDLELELTRGGTIEGRVLLPDGRDGQGAIVGVNFGDGDARTQRAGPGGVFRFEDLTPGRWQVLLREEELQPWARSFASVLEPQPIAWSCTVREGATTRYDLVPQDG